MRQPVTTASRRFYHAFYRWTLLISCPLEPHPISRRAFSHSRKVEQTTPVPEANLSFRKTPRFTPLSAGDKPTFPQRWLEEAVRTSAEVPFSTIRPWQAAIRYRSRAGIMIQIPIPPSTVQRLERRYGQGLAAEMKRRFGATVEIGSEGANGVSLLCSGAHEEVGKVWRQLIVCRDEEREDSVQTPGAEEEGVNAGTRTVHVASLGDGGREQTGRSDGLVDIASLPDWAKVANVKSYQGLPTKRITPWSFALRRFSPESGTSTIETVVPASAWDKITSSSSVEELAATGGIPATVETETGTLFSSADGQALQPLLFTGRTVDLHNIYQRLLRFNRKIARSSTTTTEEKGKKTSPKAAAAPPSQSNRQGFSLRLTIPASQRHYLTGPHDVQRTEILQRSGCTIWRLSAPTEPTSSSERREERRGGAGGEAYELYLWAPTASSCQLARKYIRNVLKDPSFYYATVALPRSEYRETSLCPILLGSKGSRVAKMREESGARIRLVEDDDDDTFVVWGGESEVERARGLMQGVLTGVCRAGGLGEVEIEVREEGWWPPPPPPPEEQKAGRNNLRYKLKVEIPKDVEIAGTALLSYLGSSVRYEVHRASGCLVRLRNSTLVLRGSEAQIRRAQALFRRKVEDACRLNGIGEVPVLREEVGGLTITGEAAAEEEGEKKDGVDENEVSRIPDADVSGEGLLREEEMSSPQYILRLAAPKNFRVAGRLLRSYLMGADESLRADVIQASGCSITFRRHNTIVLQGTEDEVRKARAAYQAKVEEICRENGVEDVPVLTDFGGMKLVTAGEAAAAENEMDDVPVDSLLDTEDIDAVTSSSGVPVRVGFNDDAPPQEKDAAGALQAAEQHYKLTVAIPNYPDSEKTFAALMVGDNHWTRVKLVQQSGCRVKVVANHKAYLRGTEKAIQKAKALLQQTIEVICRVEDVTPVPTLTDLTNLEPISASSEELLDADEVKPPKSPADVTQLKEDLKTTLRSLSHPVVLVTARHPDEIPEKASARIPPVVTDVLGPCRGVTVSSFNTVTLEPTPMVSFNLKLPSRTWDALTLNPDTCIHILSTSPTGATLAHAFTQAYEDPAEPFRRLKRIAGIGLFFNNAGGRGNAKPPRFMTAGEGVGAWISAKVLKEKCVGVGDHVVVVAEVERVRFPKGVDVGEVEALTYARRGYRGVGGEVLPMQIPALEEMAGGDEGDGVAALGVMENGDVEASEEDVDEVEFDSTAEEALFEEFSAQEDEVEDGVVGAAPAEDDDADVSSMSANGLGIAETPEGSDQDTDDIVEGSNPIDFEDLQQRYNMAPEDEAEEQSLPSPEEVDVHILPNTSDEPSAAESHEHTPSNEGSGAHGKPHSEVSVPIASASSRYGPRRGSANAWGIERPMKASYSTIATGLATYRHNSAMTAGSNEVSESPAAQDSGDTDAHVSDVSLLNKTVGDFLGTENHSFPVRHRRLKHLQEQADKASEQLRRELAAGILTPEKSAELESIVARGESRVAKTLALHSAKELRHMLDAGKMDDRRVPWLEQSIERGQAVLLAEARRLRKLFDDGEIGQQRFDYVKETLAQEMGVLRTEAMRLRRLVDEEVGEEGVGNEAMRAAKTGFDGFRGNR